MNYMPMNESNPWYTCARDFEYRMFFGKPYPTMTITPRNQYILVVPHEIIRIATPGTLELPETAESMYGRIVAVSPDCKQQLATNDIIILRPSAPMCPTNPHIQEALVHESAVLAVVTEAAPTNKN